MPRKKPRPAAKKRLKELRDKAARKGCTPYYTERPRHIGTYRDETALAGAILASLGRLRR